MLVNANILPLKEETGTVSPFIADILQIEIAFHAVHLY